jgi:xanthine dehydrogenase accessory factor
VSDIYRQIAGLVEAGSEFAVATVVATGGSSPRGVASKMLILPDGETSGSVGGGRLEKLVIADAAQALASGQSVLTQYRLQAEHEGGIGMMCGGDVDVFIEVHTAARTLLICGGGHVGQALASAARQVGMPVTVVDPRKEFADTARFPEGTRILHASPDSKEVASLVSENTYVVTMTHEHALDLAVLGNLLRRGAAYVGMIGSKRKVKTIMSKLREEGFREEELAQVHSPIGLDIGAETPAEIAVSILAEIIRHYRSGGRGDTSPESMKEKLDA